MRSGAEGAGKEGAKRERCSTWDRFRAWTAMFSSGAESETKAKHVLAREAISETKDISSRDAKAGSREASCWQNAEKNPVWYTISTEICVSGAGTA